ncbi:MAG: peptide chain release factor 2 [Oligoflexales bacterium]|nr:peptide chain release factor 2 [Oligoflexales bacterium]
MRNTKPFGGFFDLKKKQNRLSELEETIESDPDFWNHPEKSKIILKEKKILESQLNIANSLKKIREDLEAALELANEGGEFLSEAETLTSLLSSKLDQLEIQSLLSEEQDSSSAIISINAGAGGTESCDWAAMLFRMYLRYAELKGWQTSVYDQQAGDEAGLKSATFEVSGDFAYGMLKSESGVHRLVRISPFDSNARRHTSFASVFVTPVIDDNFEIEINPADLKIDTYRASGAGGQHVNTTDSAVRITHLPSGIIVQCQSERSQHQNRETALKLLKSKMFDAELAKRQKTKDELENQKEDIGWGSQIRSYVLHPYRLIKDHRTDTEFHDPNEVLDGFLEPFIKPYLVARLQKIL